MVVGDSKETNNVFNPVRTQVSRKTQALRKTDSLMAIDRPEWLFGSLCKVKAPLDYTAFKNILSEHSSGKIRKDSKTVQLHLYWLMKLGLISSTSGKQGKPRYSRTVVGDRLCEARDNDRDEYQTMLSSILLRSRYTGDFFYRFLGMIEDRLKKNDPIRVEEVRSSFRGETDRSLYSLGMEAGLVTDHNGMLGIQARKGKTIDDLEEFRQEVEKAYRALANKYVEGVELRPIYVKISTIRDIVLSVYGIVEDADFDRNFVQLLDSPHGRDINLYGAPPQWSLKKRESKTLEKESLAYKGKTYVFMSLT